MVANGLAGLCLPAWVLGRFLCRLTVLVSPFPGELLSCCLSNKKVTKEKRHPTSGSRCARLPSLRCRSGGRHTRDLPVPLCLSRPSRPLVPLRDTSTRPPDGELTPSCLTDLIAWLPHRLHPLPAGEMVGVRGKRPGRPLARSPDSIRESPSPDSRITSGLQNC